MTSDTAERQADVHRITLVGELDVARPELASALTESLDAGARRIVVDLLEVSFIDSSVLRSLLLAHRELRAREGWIRLVYTNSVVARVISVTGLEQVLPQYVSVEDALAGRRTGSGAGPETADG